ncbi:MAG: hypothetical protein ABH816_04195 [Candidatus Levyibacteriota bacterium]
MAADLEKLAKEFNGRFGNEDISKGLFGLAKIARQRGLERLLKVSPFPEGAIRLPEIETAGMSNGDMEKLADSTEGLRLGIWGRYILQRGSTAPQEPLNPVVMDARTMGIRSDYPTTKQVWGKAEEFGDKVSAEAMLKIAIEAVKGNIHVETGKPLVGVMEPVTDSSGGPDVLYVVRYEDGLWLGALYADLDDRWDLGVGFVVSPRK